jgi:phenylalanyl-tRNA synthetase alpha chain
MGNNNNQQTISDEINHLLSQKDLNETKIQEIRNISLNKYLKDLYDQLKKASGQERAQIGKNINDLRSLINTIIDAKLTTFVANNEQNNNVVNYDILINSSNHSFGCISPITKVIDDVANFFKSLNFTIQSGEEITKVKYAFDNLNVPKFHPTRDTSETFYIANDITLRQQCTATSAIVMENNTDPEIRIMNYGYVYRNDDDDASHSHQFNQVDFI